MTSKSTPQERINTLLGNLFAFKTDVERFEHEGSLIAGRFLHIIDREAIKQGVTRKELASRVKTSASYITQLMRGDKLPNWVMLARMADALNIYFEVRSAEENNEVSIEEEFSVNALEIRKGRIGCKIYNMKNVIDSSIYDSDRFENILNNVHLEYEDKAIAS